MILVDTSIWADHFRQADPVLDRFLVDRKVVVHPFVIGELALGQVPKRTILIAWLSDLRQSAQATNEEVLRLVEQQSLFGSGIGYVDAHLLAAARLTNDTRLWTRDRHLDAAAQRLGIAARPMH